jgi:ATP-dependent RNA helicase RhlE
LQEKKTELIIKLITGKLATDFCFTRTKQGANKLVKVISAGIQAAAIHEKTRGRTKALAGFKNGSLTALVATDIAGSWSGYSIITTCYKF